MALHHCFIVWELTDEKVAGKFVDMFTSHMAANKCVELLTAQTGCLYAVERYTPKMNAKEYEIKK